MIQDKTNCSSESIQHTESTNLNIFRNNIMSKTVVQIKLINLWTTQSSLYFQETLGGVWVVIAISSL